VRDSFFRALLPVLFAALAGASARAQNGAPLDVDLRSGGGAGAPLAELSDPVRAEIERAIAKVYPALVRIHVVTVDYEGGRERKFQASGSGAIITPEGHVITNHHVAGKARRITCTLASKEEVPAALVGTDALADIAILKLDLKARRDPFEPIPVASFGDSDALRVGDRVLAMGSPLALSQSVTMGVVSNLDMIMPQFLSIAGGFRLDGEDVGSLVKWIGHDAQIFPGNSGGPLVNLRGEIVGINEIGFGLSGAIPGNLAKRVASEIYRYGEVRRSWVGLELQPLLKGGEVDRGVLVAGVVDGSPAAKAGVQPGDILLSWDGQALSARFHEQIPLVNRAILETPVGKPVTFTILRTNPTGSREKKSLSLVTVLRPKAQGREMEFRSWGMTGREITMLSAKELQRDAPSGVIVSSVRAGGPASEAKPPLTEGDIVVEVGGKKLETLDDLLAVTAAIVEGKNKPVPALVAFERNGEKIATVVKLGPPVAESRPPEAKKAWFPAATQVLTAPLAEILGLKGKTGVRLTRVFPGTAAEAAGLEVGDIIVALDGEPIPASQPEHQDVFATMVRQRKIGQKVELSVIREKKELKIALELPERPREGPELGEYKDELFEFTVRDISFADRLKNRWEAQIEGAIVSAVEPGGWAQLAQLKVGDLVTEVDGVRVTDRKSLEAVMAEIAKRRPAHVVFRVRRGIHTLFVEIEPAWQ
jgi:serine protease Do